MLNNKNNIVFAAIVSCLLGGQIAFAMEESKPTLTIGAKEFRIPFEYADLTNADKQKIKFIHERFYTVLSDDSDIKAIVGPLQPCIFIGLRNDENGRTVVFHKHFSNSLDNLIKIAKLELDVKDAKNLKGRIFTNRAPHYETLMKGFGGTLTTYKDLHNSKNQVDELRDIRKRIISEFIIPDGDQIQANYYNSRLADYALGDYECAELSVLVDSKLNMKSVCVMHECIFGDYSHLPLAKRLNFTLQAQQEACKKVTKERYLGKVDDRSLNTYEKVHFEKL